MLKIDWFSTACVKVDTYANYIPFISSVTNLIGLFLKYVFKPCVNQAKVYNYQYFVFLEDKKLLRFIVLIIPVLGNILIALVDIWCQSEAKKMEKYASFLKNSDEANKASKFYLAATFYDSLLTEGSTNAKYKIGCRLLSRKGLRKGISQTHQSLT